MLLFPIHRWKKVLRGPEPLSSQAPEKTDFVVGARAALHSKAESIHTQLRRLNLKARTLDEEQLTKLFYEIFNDNAY